MKLIARFLALPAAAFLVSCHPPTQAVPAPNVADARSVLGFLGAYGRHDLDGMMKYLDDEAVFLGTAGSLSKPQIRDFFQSSFRKHPRLRVEVGSLKEVQGAVHAVVKVETEAIWTDTWIFELRSHKIHRYSLASIRR